jgi:O-antigen/teichoic acid export membrane protein
MNAKEHIEDNETKATYEIARGGSIAFLGNVMVRLLTLLTDMLIGRFIGAFGYGVYSLILSILNTTGNLSSLGLPQGVIRYGALAHVDNDKRRLKGILLSAIAIAIPLAFLIMLIMIKWAPEIADLILDSSDQFWLIQVLVWALPFLVFANIMGAFAQTYRRIDLQQLILIAHRISNLFILLLLVLFLGLGLTGVMYSYVVGMVISALLGLYIAIHLFPDLTSRRIKPTFQNRTLLRFSLPVFLSGFVYILLNNMDRLMVGYFSTTEQAGVYSAAARISTLQATVLAAMLSIAAPMMAELFARQDIKTLRLIYQQVTRWILIFSLPVFLIIIFIPDEIMSLFGDDFVSGGRILLILAIGQLVNAATGPIGKLMEMVGKQDVTLIALILVVLINFSLNIWLIPIYAAVGAAIATSASVSLIFGLLALGSFRVTGIKLYGWNLLKPIIAAVFAALLGFGIGELNVIASLGPWENYINLSIILLVYVSFVLFFGIDQSDKKLLVLLRSKLQG